MVKIKICGLSRSEDIAFANVHKPDYIGFVFAKSKRQINAEQAANLREKLNKSILCVGVFVNESIDEILRIAKKVPLDVVQLHGNEDLSYIRELRRKSSYTIWKAIQVKQKRNILAAARLPVDKILLDTYSDQLYGGTGKTFDWSVLSQLDADFLKQRVIVSGGLHSGNVAEVLRQVEPYGIDVSSGVETNGAKDEIKIETFMHTVQLL